jgi:DNA polymerase-3 subunit gamma/tau
VLDALADALHRLQVRQLVPGAEIESDGVDIDGLATKLRPELVQLWYQMALNARRDLSLAPSPRAGFEMGVLRMLAFRPAEAGAQATSAAGGDATPRVSGAAAAKAALADAAPARPVRAAPAQPAAPMPQPPAVAAPVSHIAGTASPGPVAIATNATTPPAPAFDADRWLQLVAGSELKGPAKELAAHAAFVAYDAGVLRLALSPADEMLKSPASMKTLAQALAPALGTIPQIRFEAATTSGETLHQRSARERDARQEAAENAFLADPGVQQLISQHGAQVVPDSIRPFDE